MNGVIYARYSCDKQTENSILGQIRECKIFAERNNIQILDIYKDEAISGRTAEKRPAFMKMIKDASLHFFDCVIVWKGDRFSRSRADAAKYKSELKKLGVVVLSATEANVTGPEAVLMDGINEAFAEYFSVELAAKVERGMTQNCIDGKFNGGRLPLGFAKNGTSVVVDPEGAKIVREMFDLFANENVTQTEIVNLFKSKGYKARDGKPLTKSTINRMIHCEKYYGHYKFKDAVNDEMYPAIISKELFNKAVEKCRKNHRTRQTYRARVPYLLSDKLICGECCSSMTGSRAVGRHGDVHYYYRCMSKKEDNCSMKYINKSLIEDTVISAVIEFILNKKKTEELIQNVSQCKEATAPDLTKMEEELVEINRSIDNFMLVVSKGGDVDFIVKRVKELQNERDQQIKKINEFKRIHNIFTEEHVRTFLKNLSLKDYLTYSDKKYLVDSLIQCVYYYSDEKIKVFFKYNGSDFSGGQRSGVRFMSREVHHMKTRTLIR